MSLPFNGLKSLAARLRRILTSSHKPKARRARRARLGLERLEAREVLSSSPLTPIGPSYGPALAHLADEDLPPEPTQPPIQSFQPYPGGEDITGTHDYDNNGNTTTQGPTDPNAGYRYDTEGNKIPITPRQLNNTDYVDVTAQGNMDLYTPDQGWQVIGQNVFSAGISTSGILYFLQGSGELDRVQSVTSINPEYWTFVNTVDGAWLATQGRCPYPEFIQTVVKTGTWTTIQSFAVEADGTTLMTLDMSGNLGLSNSTQVIDKGVIAFNGNAAGVTTLVGLARSNARNSGGMFGEPFPHLRRGPEPLKGMGVPLVVFRP